MTIYLNRRCCPCAVGDPCDSGCPSIDGSWPGTLHFTIANESGCPYLDGVSGTLGVFGSPWPTGPSYVNNPTGGPYQAIPGCGGGGDPATNILTVTWVCNNAGAAVMSVKVDWDSSGGVEAFFGLAFAADIVSLSCSPLVVVYRVRLQTGASGLLANCNCVADATILVTITA
jgi:hypothetical protein